MLTNGRTLDGRYVIREQIGRGGFGAVFLAEDIRFAAKNLVAVKQITLDGEITKQAFRREAEILHHLDHANLPKVTDYFQENGASFIVMDYISGQDLARTLLKGKRFTVSEILTVANTVLDALEYLHTRQIIHRDIKPHNIKIDETGKIFLLDFGTAKGGAADETSGEPIADRSITGFTPFYAPLEQVLRVDVNSFFLLQSLSSPRFDEFVKKKTDARSDVYSLGATLYHLLTGFSPEKATATIRAHALWSGQTDALPPIQSLNAAVSDRLAEIIHRSLELDPDARFQTAAEFHRAIANIHQNHSSADKSDTPTLSADAKKIPPREQAIQLSDLPLTLPVGDNGKRLGKSGAFVLFAVLLPILFAATIGGWLFWRNSSSPIKMEKLPDTPVVVNAPDEKTQSLGYSLLIQKMRDGKKYQTPFESSGQEIFENGYQFQMRLTPPGAGFFYIFAEGADKNNHRIFNIIFPTPLQNDGATKIAAAQTIKTGWNEFGGTAGTENFWIIWSGEKIPAAEKGCDDAFQNGGQIADKATAEDLKKFLEAGRNNETGTIKNVEKKSTEVKFSGNSLIYLLQLEHH